jgi:anti-sigma regulatory factor (Ser/Thr protein kinase)
MGSALLDLWLEEAEAPRTLDEAAVSQARQAAREVGAAVGLSKIAIEELAIVTSELGHNQLRHGKDGRILTRPIERAGITGAEIIAADRGPGLLDVPAALEDRQRPTGSLGTGLGGVMRLADEVDFDTRLGEGLCVRARKFKAPPPWRSEAGVFGRALPGERTSGDGALFRRRSDRLVLGVVDGLGHGQPAASAQAIARSRGVVASFAHLDRASGLLHHAAVGNIDAHLYAPRVQRRLASQSGVIGLAGQSPTIRAERVAIAPGEILVLFTDGLSTKATLADEPALLHQPPIVIAHRLFERFARDNDDALVLVVR